MDRTCRTGDTLITRLLPSRSALFVVGPVRADKKYDPGVTDVEIKIGQTMPAAGRCRRMPPSEKRRLPISDDQ